MAGDKTSLGGLARRYAAALFDLADESNKLDTVAGDLRGLSVLIAESDDLNKLISSPLFGRAQQSQAMAAVLDKAGVDDLTRKFVLVTAGNRRLYALPQIMEAFLSELALRRGEFTADVTVSHPLNEENEKDLVAAIEKDVDGKVHMNVTVDPSLLGGLVVKVGSRMIDGSIRSKLQRLQFAMKGVG